MGSGLKKDQFLEGSSEKYGKPSMPKFMVSGQNPPGQNPPDKIPLDKIPPRTKSPQDKIPLDKIPPAYFIFYWQ